MRGSDGRRLLARTLVVRGEALMEQARYRQAEQWSLLLIPGRPELRHPRKATGPSGNASDGRIVVECASGMEAQASAS